MSHRFPFFGTTVRYFCRDSGRAFGRPPQFPLVREDSRFVGKQLVPVEHWLAPDLVRYFNLAGPVHPVFELVPAEPKKSRGLRTIDQVRHFRLHTIRKRRLPHSGAQLSCLTR